MDRFDPFNQRFECRTDIGIEYTPLLGGDDMPTILREQLHAKRVLDQLDLVADGGVGEA